MTTQPAATSLADQLAAHLRDARNFHDGEACDALDPCPSCVSRRRVQRAARGVALIPEQRTKENR